jgi:hypothetical protein
MTIFPDDVFIMANLVALMGWVLLSFGTFTRNVFIRDRLTGFFWPALLCAAYAIFFVALVSGVLNEDIPYGAGFLTLKGVMTLFQSSWAVVLAWIHLLAFDLFVGTRIAKEAERDGVAPIWLTLVFPLTLLFGPLGYLLFVLLRPIVRDRNL